MGKIKWGVLGTANIARGCTIPGMLMSESCELYAVAGRSIEKAEEFRKEFGFAKAYGSYDELLDDSEVQAVYIPLPNSLHKKWVLEALKKGKNVLCEKPLGLSADEVAEMHECAKKEGVILMEAYAYLHSPYIECLKKDVESGVIGDVDYIETEFVTQGYSEDIRLKKELGGGAMYDLGCYCTTAILSLVSSEPEKVRAIAEFSEEGVDLMTSVNVNFKNGVRAAFHVGMILGKDTGARVDRTYIHGTKGYIVSNVEYNEAGDVKYKIVSEGKISERKIFAPQNYSLETENLSRSILGEEKPLVTADFSIRNAKLIDSVLKEIRY